MVTTQSLRDRIDAACARCQPLGRRKTLSALMAEIGFGRLFVIPVGCGFNALAIDRYRDQPITDVSIASSRFGQQALNHDFRPYVLALAEVMIPNLPLNVEEIERWPIVVVEASPYRVLVIDRNRILDPHVIHGLTYVLDVVLEWEFGRMHANHYQALVTVFLRPCANIGQRAEPVDTGIRPEINKDDLPTQVSRRQWFRVEPRGSAAERGQFSRVCCARSTELRICGVEQVDVSDESDRHTARSRM